MPADRHALERTRRALGRTIPAAAFSSEASVDDRAADAPRDVPPADAAAPAFVHPAVTVDGGPTAPRYEIEGMIGAGATARVFAITDRNLCRALAAKVLRQRTAEDAAAFIDEARITAALAHPNVLPVHELDVDARGDLYFTTKRIEGRSLAQAIEASHGADLDPAIASTAAIVAVFIGVCQALAYAHDHGVVHQDVKPANIMLGAYGEVLLVDWGSAARLRDGGVQPLYGTPLYMSPEQARREPIDVRADVYSLGATLFHALTLRFPTWHDDTDEFWRMKRDGRIQPLRREEREARPAALIGIALKALQPDRAARYADAGAMLADLRAFSAGLAVSAHRDSPLARLLRWHRRHRRAIWATVALGSVIFALAVALLGERLKEIATWGSPIVVERWQDGWRARWLPASGEFAADGARLVSTAPGESTMFLDRRLCGAVAIECEASVAPGAPLGDLSFVWTQAIDRLDGGRVRARDPYYLQFGAHCGAESLITGYRLGRLAFAPLGPRPGRTYRVRAEIVDDRLALIVDGRQVCEWIAPFRFDHGYIGLYAFFPGKRFANVRVLTRAAQRVPATAIGDAFAAAGDDERAEMQYEVLTDGHDGSGIADEARFKAGCCRRRQHRMEEAEALWAPLAGTRFAPLVALERIDAAFAAGDHAAVIAGFDALLADADAATRERAAMRWAGYVSQAAGPVLADYLALRDRRLSGEHAGDAAAAACLLRLDRPDQVLARFPQQRAACGTALNALGQYERVLAEYGEQPWEVAVARLNLGIGGIDGTLARAEAGLDLLWCGRAEEALAAYGDDRDVRERALVLLERFAALRDPAGNDDMALVRAMTMAGEDARGVLHDGDFHARGLAALAAGDAAGAERIIPRNDPMHAWCTCTLAIEAFARGDDAEAARWLAADRVAAAHDLEAWSLPLLIEPFLDGTRGDWSAFDRSCEDLRARGRSFGAQRPWYAARWLLGEIDDATFLSQPRGVFAPADLGLLRALRAERRGESGAASLAYAQWLATPRWRRAFEAPIPWERFAAWRARVLERGR